MKWFALLALALQLQGQEFKYEPASVRQGQVLKVSAPATAQSARFDGRTIRLFVQSNGVSFGLMPVGVLTAPKAYTLEWLDAQGTILHSAPVLVVNAHFAKQNVVLSKTLSALKSSPEEREEVGEFLKEVSPVRYWSEPLQRPIDGCVTSPFGVGRFHNGKPTGDFHAGLDQRGALGSPIRATTAGTIKLAQQFSLRGGTVAIDHGQGLESIYLHMSQVGAKEGTQVKAGEVIGYVGSTGRSTGPHLHWTLYASGEPIDPTQWVHVTACSAGPRKAVRPHAQK